MSVASEVRGNFQADVAVAALGFLIDRAQKISGVLNVANRDDLVTCLGIEIGAVPQGPKDVDIVRTPSDGFFEDCGIRGHTTQAILLDEALEFAVGDQVAADVVEPHGLAKL